MKLKKEFFLIMKINEIALLFLLFFLKIAAFSQYSALPESIQREINRLNEIINKSLKEYDAYSIEDTTVQLFTFFEFRIMDSISKNELIDGTFLKKLNPIYIFSRKGGCRRYSSKENKDSLLHTNTFIYSSKEKAIAWFGYYHKCKRKCYFISIDNVYKIYSRPQCFDALVEHIWNKKNLLVFRLDIGDGICTHFIVNEQSEVLIFYEDRIDGNYKVVTVSEYLDEIGIDYLNARGGRIRN